MKHLNQEPRGKQSGTLRSGPRGMNWKILSKIRGIPIATFRKIKTLNEELQKNL